MGWSIWSHRCYRYLQEEGSNFENDTCGTWLNKLNVLITVHCFDNSENITVSMVTNVTVHDERFTHRNASPLMRYLLHKSTPVMKKSIRVCIETAERGFALV